MRQTGQPGTEGNRTEGDGGLSGQVDEVNRPLGVYAKGSIQAVPFAPSLIARVVGNAAIRAARHGRQQDNGGRWGRFGQVDGGLRPLGVYAKGSIQAVPFATDCRAARQGRSPGTASGVKQPLRCPGAFVHGAPFWRRRLAGMSFFFRCSDALEREAPSWQQSRTTGCRQGRLCSAGSSPVGHT